MSIEENIISKEVRHKLTNPHLKLRGFKSLDEYNVAELNHELSKMNREDLIKVTVGFWQIIKEL
jgi:hypothetical protein